MVGTLELINQTQAYLNYIREHYDAVQKAWKMLQEHCAHMEFVQRSSMKDELDFQVNIHDISKLDPEEFTAYRRKFYPVEMEQDGPRVHRAIKADFAKAWEHHQLHNFHHWQSWSKLPESYRSQKTIYCVHMVIDWVAMALQRNNPLDQYYQEHKEEIHIPEWAHTLVVAIFKCLVTKTKEEFISYDDKCPKCGAGTMLRKDGVRFCSNIGGWVEGDVGDYHEDGCGWSSEDSEN